MATLTMSPLRSQLGAASSYAPSPLAPSSHHNVAAVPRPLPRRNPQFALSRPIRPFASVSHTSSTKSVKLIEPPKNSKTAFILDLTQEELGRQD